MAASGDVIVRGSTLFGPVDLERLRLRSGGMQDETVHERVRRLRERRRLSQADLASATADVVTESWIAKFEKQHRPKYPTREQLAPLVEPLGTSLAYLMAPMGVVPIEDAPIADAFLAARRAILDSDLPEERKQAALVILGDLLDANRRAG